MSPVGLFEDVKLSSKLGRNLRTAQIVSIYFGSCDFSRNFSTFHWIYSRSCNYSEIKGLGAKQAFRDEEEVGKLADLHQAKEKTPTMGGLIICFSVLISCILWAEPNVYVISALVVFIMLAGIGFADDFLKISRKNSRGLPGRYKLLGQFITSMVAIFFLLVRQQPLFMDWMPSLWVVN